MDNRFCPRYRSLYNVKRRAECVLKLRARYTLTQNLDFFLYTQKPVYTQCIIIYTLLKIITNGDNLSQTMNEERKELKKFQFPVRYSQTPELVTDFPWYTSCFSYFALSVFHFPGGTTAAAGTFLSQATAAAVAHTFLLSFLSYVRDYTWSIYTTR